MLKPEQFVHAIETEGYVVADLPDATPVRYVREALRQELRNILSNRTVELETYHELDLSDEDHLQVHARIAAFARKNQVSKLILLAQLPFFKQIFGPDVAMTCRDNVRIARPGKEIDVFGLHRDSDYGNTAYEVNLFIPFVRLDDKSGLSVVPRSHSLDQDADFRIKKVKHPTITEGSPRHQLGFMHTANVIDNLSEIMVRVGCDKPLTPPLAVGQTLAFAPHLIHGQDVNAGNVTRWSLDFEICNALAPINWKTTRGEDRFEIVSQSYFFKEGRRVHHAPN
jgi:ectoine hydroxylase-related dioxygenase (phytanoyl-CoA dioxygenase family)